MMFNFLEWVFAEGEIVTPDSEDNSQREVFTRWFKYDRDKLSLVYTQIVPVIFEPPCSLQNIVKRFGMEMSPEKYETIAFLGQVPVRCKIIVTNVYK
jgi:hypothetical protein